MKKNILIVLSIYFVITFSYSQTITFNKTYNPYAFQEADNIVVYKDGYLMLGGGIDANESGQRVKIIAYYLDEYGTVNWMKTYGDTVYNYYFGDRNSLIENVDGGFSLTGARTGQANITGMLTKFDQNFDTLWTRLYFDNPAFTAFYNHVQTPDGGYALVGCVADTDPDGDVLLVKTDSEGNMEWYKKYGTSDRDLGLCIAETEDGGYLIGGLTDDLGNGDGYLVKTDNNGNLEWTKHYGNPLYPDGAIYTIAVNSQYDYYIPLTEFVIQPINKSFYSRRYSIVKLNSDFNELWNKQFGIEAEYTALGSIIIASDGDIIATVEDNYQCGLYRISSDGDSIWKHYYIAPDVTNELCGLITLKQTEDQGFILCGVATSPQDMWLVKTDSCGCVEEECECGGNDVEQVWVDREIEVYPNPAKDVLQFNLLENTKDIRVEIYDNLGRLMITNELLGWENSIDVSQLKSGNYFVRIVSDEENWSEWFVKE